MNTIHSLLEREAEEIAGTRSHASIVSSNICLAAWEKVVHATPGRLAMATAEAWSVEAIHAATKPQKDAARAARDKWRAKAGFMAST